MTGICGWIGWEQTDDVRRAVIERMATALDASAAARCNSLVGPGAAVAACAQHQAPPILAEDGYWIVVQGYPIFSEATYAAIAGARGPAAAILTAYRERRERMLGSLRGGFALAIVSEQGSEALLAVDRIGGRFPLVYKVVDGAVIFATHARAIQENPAGRSEIDPQGIYNYLYFHMTPSPRSVRRGIRQVPPAGYVRIHNGTVHEETHWKPCYRDDEAVSIPDLCEEYRELIRRSVAQHARGARVGCFLSGGIDSSTIAGLLGPATGATAKSYSIGFNAPGFDETEYSAAAVDRFRTDQHEYILKPEDVLEAIPGIAGAYSDPFGNASAVPTYHCARLARADGLERMLGGDGGDELFAGNTRYAVQQVFQFYDRIPAGGRRLLESVVFRLPEPSGFTPIRKMQSYIRQAKLPMPQRLESYNYLERTGPDRILHPDLLASVDVDEPGRLLAEVYHSAAAETMLSRMLALDLKFTLADSDLPKVSRMCRMAGVEAVYPFLSDEMVEFSLRVPVRLKLRGLRLRWIVKHASRGFLPDKILRKKKHGFGLPFGLWMRTHPALRDFARDNLESLKNRKLVRSDYIDDLVRLHETDHATYYGVMIWALLMLEQWFQHNDSPRT